MNSISTAERRIAPRLPRTGGVELSYSDPLPSKVRAELIESSSSGFRAAHESARLVPGIEVQFSFAEKSGRARVIWTHVLQDHRISGFMLL